MRFTKGKIAFFSAVAWLIFLICCSVAHGDSGQWVQSDISFSFLGAHKKTMRFYDEIKKYCQKYDIDTVLVLAIAMYESGGNDNAISSAGARKLMQVMPKTQKEMKVSGNIEAGVKYLRKMKNIFGARGLPDSRLRSFMIMAYNGGPGRAKSGLIKIETFQYLQGVSLYFNLLSQRTEEIKRMSEGLEILRLGEDKTWQELSGQLGVSMIELRLYNPFAAHRFSSKIPAGWFIAYPKNPQGISFEIVLANDGNRRVFYKARRGDILHYIANAFGATYDEVRDKNDLLLWGSLQPGDRIEVTDSKFLEKGGEG